MRVVAFASHDLGCAGLAEIMAHRDEIAAVFTDEDPADFVCCGSVVDFCRRHRLPCSASLDASAPPGAAMVRDLRPEIVLVLGHRGAIAADVDPVRGALRLHPGLSPRDDGATPINWALARGATETGVTLHRLSPGGDVVGERRTPIDFEDTAFTLAHRLTAAARALLKELLPQLAAGTAPRTLGDAAGGAAAPAWDAANGQIDWRQSALAIYNLVRAATRPHPGAFTELDGRTLYVWQAHPVAGDGNAAAAGEVLVQDRDGGTSVVQTGAGRLRLEEIQIAGERATEGAALTPRTRLGPR